MLDICLVDFELLMMLQVCVGVFPKQAAPPKNRNKPSHIHLDHDHSHPTWILGDTCYVPFVFFCIRMVTPRNSEPVTRKLLGHLGQEILSHPFIGDTYHYALFQEFQFFSRLSDVWIFVNRKIRRLDTPATLMSLPDTWLWESQAIHLKLFHCVLFFSLYR